MSGADETTVFAGIAVRQIEGEARVAHPDVARALAYAQARILAKLIAEHSEKLRSFGVLHSEVQNSGPKGGRRGEVFFLNRKQVLYLCAKSEQPLAIEVTTQMVHVFDRALTMRPCCADSGTSQRRGTQGMGHPPRQRSQGGRRMTSSWWAVENGS